MFSKYYMHISLCYPDLYFSNTRSDDKVTAMKYTLLHDAATV